MSGAKSQTGPGLQRSLAVASGQIPSESIGGAAQNGSAMKRDNVVTKAVVNYLKEHGYEASALKLLEEESALRSSLSSARSWKRKRGAESNDLNPGPQTVYRRLQDWLASSLDQFRDELWPISWAVYVAAFFRLIEEEKYDAAIEFRETFKEHHMHAHQDELSDMRLVSTKQTLQNSEFFKRFRDGRFEVQLCKYSVDLLVSFLLSNNLSFALSVLNDKISIVERGSLMPPPHASCLTTSEGLPREAQEAYAGSRIVTGYSKVEVLHINTKPVRWGVPKELRSLYEETCAAKKAIPVPKTSKERIRLKRAQEQQVESCPPTNTEFFSTLCKFVVEPLRSGNLKLGAEVPTDEDAGSGNGKSIPKGGRDTGGSASAPNKSIPASSDAKKSSTSESVSHGKARKAESKSSSRASSAKKLPGWPSIGFHTFYNSHNSLTCAEASVDSSVVVAGFDDSKLRLWQHLNVGFNLEAERNISATLEDERIREDCRRHSEDLVSHSGPVYGCSISRDSRSILSCSADGLVKLWIYLPPSSRQSDTGSTETKHSNKKLWFNVHNFRPRSYATPVPIWDVKFSPVGYYFATASHDNVARLWDVEHNGSLRDFQGHISDVDCLTWHPNCHYIATGSSDKTVRLWDINKAQCCRLFTGHVSGVSSVTIDHTGRYLVSAETSGLIFVWDLVAGKRIKILQGHRSPVWSLSCSPDGRFVGSGSADTTIRIWETSHIWGKNSGTRDTIDSTSQAKKHGFLANQAVRTFRTKFTGVSFLRFQNERFVLACGNFSLPLMS